MTNPTMSLQDQLKAALAENALLSKKLAQSLKFKVSEKGALSVYGLGRFPVTLYKEQWLKLLAVTDDVREFIHAHPELKTK